MGAPEEPTVEKGNGNDDVEEALKQQRVTTKKWSSPFYGSNTSYFAGRTKISLWKNCSVSWAGQNCFEEL